MYSKLHHVEELGELFADVQLSGLFPDSKSFSDAIPKKNIQVICSAYQVAKGAKQFSLKDFINDHFVLPEDSEVVFHTNAKHTPREHINQLWDKLSQYTPTSEGTLIGLPHPFIKPGGRFREFFYWDSYFTMLGLQVDRRIDLMQSMVDNFAYLVDTYGRIPNGTRSYFLSRSQPPFFSLMVELLCAEMGDGLYTKYTSQLQAEYDFWMKGESQITSTLTAKDRVVLMPEGEILNRYFDDLDTPRPEGYYEDLYIADEIEIPKRASFYRNIRAACESGWDFSGRWFADQQHLKTIRTTEIIPIDLNCLLWKLERTLAICYTMQHDTALSNRYQEKAERRHQAIQKYLWDGLRQVYLDYHFPTQKSIDYPSMAMVFPLFFQLATAEQSAYVLDRMKNNFLQSGGLLTSLRATSQQWDSPNGWAPLQWMGYKAAKRYEQNSLATQIARHWTSNVERVFHATGKMMEKYNVINTSLPGGGGEYENQDGFGWTNGVYLALCASEKW